MSSPPDESLRGRIAYDGTSTPFKTILFLAICVVWIVPGLIGHDPWKTDEAVLFGTVVEILRSGDWTVLRIAGEPFLEKGPLFAWAAALLAKGLGSLFPLHDAARLASGLFMGFTLGFLGLASRELLGERSMRVSVLLLLGCLGLLIRAHEMSSEMAGLSGVALALYGLALAARRPLLGGVPAGVGLGIAFLGEGFLMAAMIVAFAALLPFAHGAWRRREYALTLAIAALCAAPLTAAWPLALASVSPGWVRVWLDQAAIARLRAPLSGSIGEFLYFVKLLPWYAWPAWPLAAWSVWRSRKMLRTRKAIAFPLAAFIAFLVVLSLFSESREVSALPLLLPLAILGVADLDSVPRGGASALDWFGVMTFFLFAALIWAAWIALMTGRPEGLLVWIRNEVPGYHYGFSFPAVALAALLTLMWLAVVARSLRSTRRALVNWTAGITMAWMLVMTLGVPLVDQARSYRAVSAKLLESLPPGFGCIASRNLGDAQRALLDYFRGIRTIRVDQPAASRCQVLLSQEFSDRNAAPSPPAGWSEVWRGSRPGDKHEVFVLYARQ